MPSHRYTYIAPPDLYTSISLHLQRVSRPRSLYFPMPAARLQTSIPLRRYTYSAPPDLRTSRPLSRQRPHASSAPSPILYLHVRRKWQVKWSYERCQCNSIKIHQTLELTTTSGACYYFQSLLTSPGLATASRSYCDLDSEKH